MKKKKLMVIFLPIITALLILCSMSMMFHSGVFAQALALSEAPSISAGNPSKVANPTYIFRIVATVVLGLTVVVGIIIAFVSLSGFNRKKKIAKGKGSAFCIRAEEEKVGLPLDNVSDENVKGAENAIVTETEKDKEESKDLTE